MMRWWVLVPPTPQIQKMPIRANISFFFFFIFCDTWRVSGGYQEKTFKRSNFASTLEWSY
jgi:hypothetical protein